MKKYIDEEITQISLLKYSLNYLNLISNKGIDTGKSSLCYLTPWAETPGYGKLIFKINPYRFFLKNVIIKIRYILSVLNCFNYILIDYSSKKKFDTVIISWAKEKDFINGFYKDRYFQLQNNETEGVLWYLIYLDKNLPEININNTKLIYRTKTNFFIKLYKFILTFISLSLENRISFSKILHYFSSLTIFGNIVSDFITNDYKNIDYSKIILPYEGQPFQNIVFNSIKNLNKEIKTIGFSHSALLPLPLNMIYRNGAPDILKVSGSSQYNYLVKYLNWPGNRIEMIPSFRYRKNNNEKIDGFIFFPYFLNSIKKISNQLEYFLKKSKNYSLNSLIIRNHPSKLNSTKHIKLEKELNKILNKYSDKFDDKGNKFSIFIGATTSIILALEKKIDVVHICENPLFELYNKNIWDYLDITELTPNLYIYKLNKFENYITFETENLKLEDYF